MANELFNIIDQQTVSVVEFRLPPEMDAMIFDSLMENISAKLNERSAHRWVLDLSQVGYVNSSGLGMLCNIRQQVRSSKGKLALCGLSPRMIALFRSCCLERLFLIVNTRAEAVAAVKK
jgi:anti-anti-sigma factor